MVTVGLGLGKKKDFVRFSQKKNKKLAEIRQKKKKKNVVPVRKTSFFGT